MLQFDIFYESLENNNNQLHNEKPHSFASSLLTWQIILYHYTFREPNVNIVFGIHRINKLSQKAIAGPHRAIFFLVHVQ